MIDNYKLKHSLAVARKMVEIGKEYNLNDDKLQDLFVLGFNHDIGYEYENNSNHAHIGSITKASCLVATGDYSLAIFTRTEHKHCDIAAVKVIVEEAGGKVSDLFGNDQRYDQSIKGALISNGIVHNEVIDVIKDYIIED